MDVADNNNSSGINSPEVVKPDLPRTTKFNVDLAADTVKNKGKKKFPIILGITAALILFGLFWQFFLKEKIAQLAEVPFETQQQEEIVLDELVPLPITGVLVKPEEAGSLNLRPLGVMVNNYVDARPQSGLIYADVVYEIVAEGGITRFLAFFLNETPEKIGPVRSVRDYYLTLVKELGDAMIMHIGWSPQALEAIETWPVRSLGRGGAPFWRDNPRNVATEHTAYIDGTVMREVGDNLGWDGTREFDSWLFKDAPDMYSTRESATKLEIDFWFEGDYSAIFDYDAQTNSYLRSMGYDSDGNPIAHSDQETGEQISVKNVIVQFVPESPVEGDDKNRLSYQLVGSGTGYVFLDGKVLEVTWSKEDRDGRTKFYDLDGNEIKFNRGKFWVSIVPDRNVEQVVFN